MRKNLQPFFAAILSIAANAIVSVQAVEDFHEFANKDGQKIEAKIVSVTPDWKTMKIQRRDGKDFDMPINVLSLDDQQLVKTWIEANPSAAKVDYNLEVNVEKKAKTTGNERGSYYKYKTMEVTYEVSIKNRTREDLVGSRADYVVIMEDVVSIYRDSSGRLDYSGGSFGTGETGEIKYVRKSEKLPESLATNYNHTFVTEAIQHHEILGDGNVSYGEDKILGVILRVVGPNDEVIGEYRSPEAYVQKVTWDKVKGNAFASNATAPRTAAATLEMPASIEPASATPGPPEIPEWLEVRELDSWPAMLQKGDFILTRNMPRWGQRAVRITAFVDIDEDNSGGVIVACGGSSKGFSLFVLNDELHFWSRKAFEGNRTRWLGIKVALSEVPKEEFQVEAEFGAETLTLWVDGEIKAQGASVGLLNFRPNEGLSVGYDSENSSVGPAAPPHAFRGSIRDVEVNFEA